MPKLVLSGTTRKLFEKLLSCMMASIFHASGISLVMIWFLSFLLANMILCVQYDNYIIIIIIVGKVVLKSHFMLCGIRFILLCIFLLFQVLHDTTLWREFFKIAICECCTDWKWCNSAWLIDTRRPLHAALHQHQTLSAVTAK